MRSKSSVKIMAALIVAACLILGLIGIVLPLIPGLLFLAIGAAVVARHSSWAREHLHRHDGIRRCLHHADRVLDSDWPEKLKLTGLYLAKSIVDGLDKASQWLRGWLDAKRDPRQSSFRT